jgi:hypothetical protein
LLYLMGSGLYAEALQLLQGRIAETLQRSLPLSLAARAERLERELQLARANAAGNAELASILEELVEYVAAQRKAIELAAKLASRAGTPSLKVAFARLSLSETKLCELIANLASTYKRQESRQ